jgi:tetratricopeptide (TPR) repeat protein
MGKAVGGRPSAALACFQARAAERKSRKLFCQQAKQRFAEVGSQDGTWKPVIRTIHVVLLCLVLAAPAVAQDAVFLSTGSGGGRTKVSGRVLDYTGRELQMELAGSRQQSYPSAQVLQIETAYGSKQVEADAAFAKGRCDQALTLYQQAMKDEPRRWVQRQILAGIINCYHSLEQDDRAGEMFSQLLRADPLTPYFDCIPLAWMPRQPSLAVEKAAAAWLGREEPAMVLLGASHLLTSPRRAAAIERLNQLAAGDQRPVAAIAAAQLWRTALATAGDAQLDGWGRTIDALPEKLQGGPYFVLGSARAQRKQWEPAALALLRVPILYPRDRPLAAQSLLDAARALQESGQESEAVRLYRELLRTYPDQTRPVMEAKGRMKPEG